MEIERKDFGTGCRKIQTVEPKNCIRSIGIYTEEMKKIIDVLTYTIFTVRVLLLIIKLLYLFRNKNSLI